MLTDRDLQFDIRSCPPPLLTGGIFVTLPFGGKGIKTQVKVTPCTSSCHMFVDQKFVALKNPSRSIISYRSNCLTRPENIEIAVPVTERETEKL